MMMVIHTPLKAPLVDLELVLTVYHILLIYATTRTFTFAGYQPIVLRYLITSHAQEYASFRR